MAEKKASLENPSLEDFDPHYRRMLEKTLGAMEDLARITEKDAARIPEPVFVQHILPMLTNYSGNQDLTRWQQVAGHVMRPLEVFDPRTQETLFRVPPILRKIDREFTGRGRQSAYEILQTAEQKRKVVPRLGDAHIRNHLGSRIEHVPVDPQDIYQWNSILKRYGYEPVVKKEKAPESTDESSDTDPSFVQEYDDL